MLFTAAPPPAAGDRTAGSAAGGAGEPSLEPGVSAIFAGMATQSHFEAAHAAGVHVLALVKEENDLFFQVKMAPPSFVVLLASLSGSRDPLRLARLLMTEFHLHSVIVLDALHSHQIARVVALGPLGCLVEPLQFDGLVAALAAAAGRIRTMNENGRCAGLVAANQPISGGLDPSQLERTRRFVECNFHRPIGVADMARQLGLSVNHFAQLFRRATGVTPFQALSACRIEEAKALLSLSNRTIAEIAEDVGYSGQSQFTTAFRRSVGVTPAQFRARC